MTKMYLVLQEINANKMNIRKTNSKIVVGTSNQINLAREMEQKLNGVGMFLTKLTNFEQKKWRKSYGAWEEDVDCFFYNCKYIILFLLKSCLFS